MESRNKSGRIDLYDGIIMLLASGGRWKVAELAKETGHCRASVRQALKSLTYTSPKLVEDDRGRVFFYEAKQ